MEKKNLSRHLLRWNVCYWHNSGQEKSPGKNFLTLCFHKTMLSALRHSRPLPRKWIFHWKEFGGVSQNPRTVALTSILLRLYPLCWLLPLRLLFLLKSHSWFYLHSPLFFESQHAFEPRVEPSRSSNLLSIWQLVHEVSSVQRFHSLQLSDHPASNQLCERGFPLKYNLARKVLG